MESSIIAKIDRSGNGHAVYLGHRSRPSIAGLILLQNYSEEEEINHLIARGDARYIAPEISECEDYHTESNDPWDVCKPKAISGGTTTFFGEYWGPGTGWLYIWTPDGWFASKGTPGFPPMSFLKNEDTSQDPEWRSWLERVQEFQVAQPLGTIIEDYLKETTQDEEIRPPAGPQAQSE